MKTQNERDGIVTLTEGAAREASVNTDLWNDDLRPCTRAEHSWGASRFASLWIGMCLCIPTYSLASGMITLGMNWWEAVLTIFVGSFVVLVPILLVAHAVANGYYVGAINRVGFETPWNMGEFYGQSYLVDPRGQFVAIGSRDKDEVVVGEMDRRVIEEVRNTWQFYRDRRPDMYDDMVKP